MLDVINKVSAKGRNVFLSFLGGETTLYPLKEIFKEFKDLETVKAIRVITNLSQSADYYIDLNKYLNNKLTIIASYHETECILEDFFNTAVAIKKAGIIIRPSCVITEDNVEMIDKYKVLCRKYDLPVGGISNKASGDLITSREILEHFFEDEPEKGYAIVDGVPTRKHIQLLLKDNNYFKGMFCSCVQDNMRINPNGKVFASGSCSEYYLGNYKEGYVFKYQDYPIVCKRDGPCGMCGNYVISDNIEDYINVRTKMLR